jgi:hypothetical protein
MMPRKSKHERLSGKGAENTLDPVFAHGSPNPDRIGCPPHNVLEQLARRELPIDDAWYDHLAECSPCYREFRSLQIPEIAKASKPTSLVAAVVVVVLGIAATGYWVSQRQDRPIQIAKTSTPPQARAVPAVPAEIVDLANVRQLRGSAGGSNVPSILLVLPATEVTMHLPIGWETGAYAVTLLDGTGKTVLTSMAQATTINHRNTLTLRLETATLNAGAFRIRLRRQGESSSIDVPALLR